MFHHQHQAYIKILPPGCDDAPTSIGILGELKYLILVCDYEKLISVM